ncbi:MAG: hypothetical protein HY963_03685 [Ignavibacteriales bacterium]|nr:hypothetical protein [Ignavibacteriales bacterium]
MKNQTTAKKFWSFEKLCVIVLSLIIFLSISNLEAKTVMGIVIDKATGKPITDALVILLEKEKIYATTIVDTAGMFFFTNVEIEEFDLWTKRMGYAQIKTGPFQLTKLDILNLVIKMEAADIIMSEIVIDEKTFDAYLDKVGFESRKHGTGTYLSYRDIMKRPFVTSLDVLKTIPFVIVKILNGDTRIYSASYEWRAGFGQNNVSREIELKTTSGLDVYIDGVYEEDHNRIHMLNPHDIAGIEFYKTEASTPGQYVFLHRGQTGVLLIWTKK